MEEYQWLFQALFHSFLANFRSQKQWVMCIFENYLSLAGMFILDGCVCLYFLVLVSEKGTKEYEPLDKESDFVEPLKK